MKKMSGKQKIIEIVQQVGLAIIVGLSLLYAMFRQRISEKFIRLPGLDFPIFVGEIVMVICFVLFVLKLFLEYRNKSLRVNWVCWGTFFVYSIWVITTALTGYFTIGAFAFRTAALFYYALFAVMAFHFFRKDFFSQRSLILLILAMLILTFQNMITLYYQAPFLLTLLFLLLSVKNPTIRIGGIVFLVLIVFLNFSGHASMHRSHMAGILGTLTFLLIFGLTYISKNNVMAKRLLIGFFVIAVLGMFVFLDSNVRRSFALQTIIDEYKNFDDYIQQNKHLFIFRDVPPNLYQNDEIKYSRRPITDEERARRDDPFPDLAMVWPGGEPGRPRPQNVSRFDAEPRVNENDVLSRFVPQQPGRNIYQSRNQILFRIFIWRDMLEDMKSNPYSFLVGVGFHKQQRSHSIEILGWGRQEWGRDGWIAPHNSFFNLIYRGGVLGLLLIVGMITLVIRMAIDFGRIRLLSGGLLIGALVYWLVISNFLVFLEVPHTAIPFWSFLGVMCAYWRDCTQKRIVQR